MSDARPFNLFEMKDSSSWVKPGVYRIIFWSDRVGHVIIFGMPKNKREESSVKRPFLVSKEWLLSSHKDGLIVEIKEKKFPKIITKLNKGSEADGGDSEKKRREKILIDFMKLDLFGLLLTNSWHRTMKELGKHSESDCKTVGRLICRYLASGFNVDAALNYRYGRPRKERALTKKQGKPRNVYKTGHTQKPGINRQDHKQLVRRYLELKGDDRPKSIQAQIDDLYANYAFERFESQGEDGHIKGVPFAAEDRLTYTQYRTLLNDVQGNLVEELRGVPKSKRDQLTRPLSSTADDLIPYPGHTYIVDSTVADVYLVSAFNRARIIGRPVVYCVIDAMSRLILALYVTLFPPSFSQARNAIYLALSDKKLLLEHLGILRYQDSFRAGMRPLTLLFDRAELMSESGRYLAKTIEMSSSITAPYKGAAKGIVERVFGVFNQILIHWLPGAVVKMDRERGMPDHRLDAVLTLKEFWRIMMNYVYRVNAATSLNKKILPSMMRETKETSRLALWDWGRDNLHGSPYVFSRDELMGKILPNHSVTISRDGIVFQDRKYFADWMMSDENFIRARAGYPGEAKIVLPPEFPDRAFCNMGDDIYREMRFQHTYSTSSATFTDVLDFEGLKSNLGVKDEYTSQHIRDTAVADTHEIIQRATAETTACIRERSMSNRERTTSIALNRKMENELKNGENFSAQLGFLADKNSEVAGNSHSEQTKKNDDVAELIRNSVRRR